MSDFEKEDRELAAMMGDKFVDETVPLSEAKKPATKHETEVQDAEWYPTKQRNWMDNLADCMKSTMLFGGLNILIWYWEIAGLMDESIAMPSMLVCAVLAGVGVGKVIGRKCR
jgi:hypothetical protein